MAKYGALVLAAALSANHLNERQHAINSAVNMVQIGNPSFNLTGQGFNVPPTQSPTPGFNYGNTYVAPDYRYAYPAYDYNGSSYINYNPRNYSLYRGPNPRQSNHVHVRQQMPNTVTGNALQVMASDSATTSDGLDDSSGYESLNFLVRDLINRGTGHGRHYGSTPLFPSSLGPYPPQFSPAHAPAAVQSNYNSYKSYQDPHYGERPYQQSGYGYQPQQRYSQTTTTTEYPYQKTATTLPGVSATYEGPNYNPSAQVPEATRFNPLRDRFSILTGDDDTLAGIAYFNNGYGKSYSSNEIDFYMQGIDVNPWGHEMRNPWIPFDKQERYGKYGIPTALEQYNVDVI